jgi:CHAD domain-containing protein
VSYRLDLDQPPAVTARQTLVGVLDKAVGRFDDEGGDRATLLHDVRRDLKKSRSLLRLMRPAVAEGSYAAEMATLRESARTISAARDADVAPVALRALQARYVGRLPDGAYAAFEAVLAERAAGTGDDLVAQRDVLAGVRKDVADWPLRTIEWTQVFDGLQRTYRRGRKAMSRARREASVEDLHEWRKRAKDLVYQVSLMESAWPAALEAYVEQAKRLADLLGDDHDLAMLVVLLDEPGGLAEQVAVPADPLIELAEQRRAQLQHKAWRLGRRLYGEPPKAFRRRIARLVRDAQAGHEEPPSTLGRAA